MVQDSQSRDQSIRVAIEKIDNLVDMVGELVITQSMLGQIGEDFSMDQVERMLDGLAELERNTRELQESVMQIRMLPIGVVFNRTPRLVHDLGRDLGREVDLVVDGEDTELDKAVMEQIWEPLSQLVRNGVTHGIEPPDERVAAGKSLTGTIHLNARHQGGSILIEIEDDGRGINPQVLLERAIERGVAEEGEFADREEIHELLFHPGFSALPGDGVPSGAVTGMGEVRRQLRLLGGDIKVHSVPGEGSRFTIHLPLTLAILDGQLLKVGEEIYIVPLVSIIESIQTDPENVNRIANQAEVYKLRDEYLPVVRLHRQLEIEAGSSTLEEGLLVVVEANGRRAALLVDELLAQQQVVIKNLESNFRKMERISGATILGDGTVALILDVGDLVAGSELKTAEVG